MNKIVAYLIVLGIIIVAVAIYIHYPGLPYQLDQFRLLIMCVLIGGIGGVIYCLRGVYLNKSVHNQWDKNWETWYWLRPLVSLACGGVSFVFLKAGLLVLEANSSVESTHLGFLALAFIAGYNVDKFLIRIESVAQSAFGVDKSRTGTASEAQTNTGGE